MAGWYIGGGILVLLAFGVLVFPGPMLWDLISGLGTIYRAFLKVLVRGTQEAPKKKRFWEKWNKNKKE